MGLDLRLKAQDIQTKRGAGYMDGQADERKGFGAYGVHNKGLEFAAAKCQILAQLYARLCRIRDQLWPG